MLTGMEAGEATEGRSQDVVTVPVGIWRGTRDANVSADDNDWLLAHIPTAQGNVYDGAHLPGPDVYSEIYDWLRAA